MSEVSVIPEMIELASGLAMAVRNTWGIAARVLAMADVEQGPPAERSDADLDRLAEVSPDDVEDGAEYWEDNAPEPFKDLPEADVLPDEESP